MRYRTSTAASRRAPQGKERQTYSIENGHIFNNKGKEVFKEDSVDRNRILANYAYQTGRAVIVTHKGKSYVVDNKQGITSMTTGKVMQWGPENGDRRDILNLAQQEFRKTISKTEGEITSQLVNWAKAIGIPVHNRAELMEYLKEHPVEGLQQAIEDLEKNSNFASQSDLNKALSAVVEASQSGNWNPESTQQLNNILKEIKNGRVEYKRYPGRVHEAYRSMAGEVATGAWLLFTRDGRTMEEKSRTLTPEERYAREEADKPGQERALIAWAKAAGVWYENASEPVKGMKHLENLDGGEAMIFEKDAHTYRKLISNDYFITPQLMLDRIVIHNALSPAKLILQGFTQDKDGNLLFVVDQTIVEGTTPTDAEIKKLAKTLKLNKHPKFRGNTFLSEDGTLYVSDLHDENVIVNPEGDAIIIDTEARLNTPELGEEGTYVPSNELVLQTPSIQTYTTPQGEIYGFMTKDGQMYLDENVIKPEHPLHEYTHLWDRVVAQKNPRLWKQGVELMKRLDLWKTIEESDQYGKRWEAMKGMTANKIEDFL